MPISTRIVSAVHNEPGIDLVESARPAHIFQSGDCRIKFKSPLRSEMIQHFVDDAEIFPLHSARQTELDFMTVIEK